MKKLFTLLTLLLCAVSMSWGAKIGFTSTKSDDKILAPTVTVQNNLVVTLAKGTQDTGSNKDNLFWGSETKLAYADGATVTQNRTQCGGAAVTSINENAWSGAKYAVASGYKFTVTDVQVDIAGQDYTWGYRLDVVNGDGTVEFTTSGTVNTPKNSSKRQVIATGKSIALTGDAYVKLYYYVTGTTSNSKYMYIPELYLTGTVEEDNAPSISASPQSVTLAATESGVAVNSSFTITGSNLTAGTYNLTIPSVTGLEVFPTSFTVDANGTVSQEVNLSYSSTENVPSNTASIMASVDDINLSVAVNYSASVVSWTLQTINSAKTWDFTKLTANTSSELYNSKDIAIKLSAETNPKSTDEIVYEDYKDADMAIASDFDGTALAFTGQYPIRKNEFCQNGTLHFKTSVPGTIKVKFSDTGSSASATAVKRYLVVNDENTEYWTSRENNGTENPYSAQLNVTTGEISVPAGDVTIKGSSAIVVSYLSFTPTAEPAEPTTGGDETYLTTTNNMDGWRAFYDASNGYTLDANTTAYVATANNAGSVTLTPLAGGVPSGTPVILKTTSSADNHKMTLTKATVNAYEGTNLLEWTTTAVDSKYRLGYGDKGVGFYPYSGTPASGAVILNTSGGAKALTFVFSDPTGISSVSAKKAVSTGKMYNLSGQIVGEGYKGIVIVNGKKVIK